MNKKELLLQDALGHDEGLSFARQAAALARRRHAAKRVGIAGGLTAAGVAAFLVANHPTPAALEPQAPSVSAVEIISDQELVAQLKDQPVLFIKNANRITGVVFLTDTGKKL